VYNFIISYTLQVMPISWLEEYGARTRGKSVYNGDETHHHPEIPESTGFPLSWECRKGRISA
jgi:hypothetical protein